MVHPKRIERESKMRLGRSIDIDELVRPALPFFSLSNRQHLKSSNFLFLPTRSFPPTLYWNGPSSRAKLGAQRQGGRGFPPPRWRVPPLSFLLFPALSSSRLPSKLTFLSLVVFIIEQSLSQAALVQSRLRNQLRETRDEIAYLRAELDKDQSSNRIQIIQELIVVSSGHIP